MPNLLFSTVQLLIIASSTDNVPVAVGSLTIDPDLDFNKEFTTPIFTGKSLTAKILNPVLLLSPLAWPKTSIVSPYSQMRPVSTAAPVAVNGPNEGNPSGGIVVGRSKFTSCGGDAAATETIDVISTKIINAINKKLSFLLLLLAQKYLRLLNIIIRLIVKPLIRCNDVSRPC
jgi:hypothetical protein